MPFSGQKRQITFAPQNHLLTNAAVWSPDSAKLVYDVRSDSEGACFDGTRIETVALENLERRILYNSQNGACCGVVTCSPVEEKYVFILGPEFPSDDWQYAVDHRRGIVLQNSDVLSLDARNIRPPFTPGALRGGSHVHVFSGDGKWISFTYHDQVLNQLGNTGEHDFDQRNIGVSIPIGRRVTVPKSHARNHDGTYFSILVTKTVNHPKPGSDEINRAYEESWVGTNGYLRPDGSRQKRALAFLGDSVSSSNEKLTEVFLIDFPDDLERTLVDYPMDHDPWTLAGTETRRPQPPPGVIQRRLTFTRDRLFPGVSGPRHWVRSSPDGSKIAFLMRDDRGIVQIWTVSPNGGSPVQITYGVSDVASAFSWNPDGKHLAFLRENRICLAAMDSGKSISVTEPSEYPISPLAVVFSPDGGKIAYLRNILHADGNRYNQIFVFFMP